MRRRVGSLLRTDVLLVGAALLFGLRMAGCAAGEDHPSESEDDAGIDGSVFASDAAGSDDGSSDGGTPPVTGPCSEDGWCRVVMPNDRAALYGIWGSAANDVWAVGSNGTILHWNGTAWSEQRLLTDAGQPKPLFGIWGSGPDDVWAFTSFEILHATGWNGAATNWSSFEMIRRVGSPTSMVGGIWGSGKADVWTIVGSTAGASTTVTRCFHSEGWVDGGVTQVAALDLYRAPGIGTNFLAMWGTGPKDVWLVGESGRIVHTDGFWGGAAQWTQPNSHTRSHLRGVWGTATDDVWAVGANGTIRHYTYDEGGELYWGPSDSTTTETLNAIWGSSASDVWVVGTEGTILHGDGASWTRSQVPDLPSSTTLHAIWGSGPDDIWVVGDRVILHRGGPAGVGGGTK